MQESGLLKGYLGSSNYGDEHTRFERNWLDNDSTTETDTPQNQTQVPQKPEQNKSVFTFPSDGGSILLEQQVINSEVNSVNRSGSLDGNLDHNHAVQTNQNLLLPIKAPRTLAHVVRKLMTPLEYLLFGLNMIFFLCYLSDFENLHRVQSISFEESPYTGNLNFYPYQKVSAFGFQPSVMFSIQLLVLFMFTLKLSMSASYFINVQLFDEEKQEEYFEEVQPVRTEFFKQTTPSINTKNAKLHGKYLKKSKLGKIAHNIRKTGNTTILSATGLKRQTGKLSKDNEKPDQIEVWTENAAFLLRISFFLANLMAIIFAVNVFDE